MIARQPSVGKGIVILKRITANIPRRCSRIPVRQGKHRIAIKIILEISRHMADVCAPYVLTIPNRTV